MNDNELQRCAKFRTKERLPVLTYFARNVPGKQAVLFRCSQNKAGWMTSRCEEDEKMIRVISDTLDLVNAKEIGLINRHNVKIYDARGYYAALGNKLAGKGFEEEEYYKCDIDFLNIPNIHAVRGSYC